MSQKKHPDFDCLLLTDITKNQNVLHFIVFNSDR